MQITKLWNYIRSGTFAVTADLLELPAIRTRVPCVALGTIHHQIPELNTVTILKADFASVKNASVMRAMAMQLCFNVSWERDARKIGSMPDVS